MNVYDLELKRLDGTPGVLSDVAGKTTLVVNVASKCGLTPQYEGLQALYEKHADENFAILGVPCNQFMEQEPGTADEISEFCSVNYGVSFPLAEKVDVNGEGQHALYAELCAAADEADGHTGDIRWNFEKFLVGPDGAVVKRFAPTVNPDDAALTDAIEQAL